MDVSTNFDTGEAAGQSMARANKLPDQDPSDIDEITANPCLPFARVAFVSGSQVVALIENDRAHLLEQVQVGTLVKIDTPGSTAVGIISTLSVPLPADGPGKSDLMTVEIELLGEILGECTFQRGVTWPPQLNAVVTTTSERDLKLVYARPEKETARIGTIYQNYNIPGYIMPNELLGRHFAIVGTTGCGKSCTATLILRALIEERPFAHILVLDPHNEYAAAFPDAAIVHDTSNLELPFWMLEFNELLEIIAGTGHRLDQAETSILEDAILAGKRQAGRPRGKGRASRRKVTVDTPVPYRLNELIQYIDQSMGRIGKATSAAPYLKIMARLTSLQNDPRYGFMFGSLSVRDNMREILAQLFRVPSDGKPISIVDLSGVPSEVINVVVSVLCRLTFDFAMLSNRQVPILLVCEESHRYAPKDQGSDFEPTKRALSRIAKEGRKHGVSLCLISQRPAEIETGTLSQCSTIFAMRLTNEADQAVLKAIVSDSALGFAQSLPSLSNGEAIAVGEGVPVPMRLRLDELAEDQRPCSETADFSAKWRDNIDDQDFLTDIVDRWRNQR
ncbi:MAG: ATP-binding protein [Alphaproteobacteria bacterium]|nr:ATP-binding protein [Alphaproteobacteria bacterium]